MATLLRVSAKYITYYYNSRILSKLVLVGLNFHASLYLPFSGVSLFSRLTDDHSRVVLTPIEGEPGSDYINATRVDVSETLPMITYASKT